MNVNGIEKMEVSDGQSNTMGGVWVLKGIRSGGVGRGGGGGCW